MSKKARTIVVITSVTGILLFIIFIIFALYISFKKIVVEKLAEEIKEKIIVSEVLKNEIGELKEIEYKFFPIFNFKAINDSYEATLSYNITTINGEKYTVIVYIDSEYQNKVYAYKIKDKLIYEKLYLEKENDNENISLLEHSEFFILIDFT